MASIPPPNLTVPSPPAAPRRKKAPWWVWIIVSFVLVCGGSSVLLGAWVLLPFAMTKSDTQLREDFKRLQIPARLVEIDAHNPAGHELNELHTIAKANPPEPLNSAPKAEQKDADTRALNTLRDLAERHDSVDFGAFAALDPGQATNVLIRLQSDLSNLMARGAEALENGDVPNGRRDIFAATKWMRWLHGSHFPGTHLVFAEVLEMNMTFWIQVLEGDKLSTKDKQQIEDALKQFEQPLAWQKAVEAEPVKLLEELLVEDTDNDERALTRSMVAAKLDRITRTREYVKNNPNDLLGLADELRKTPARNIFTGGMSGSLVELISTQTQDLVEAEVRRQALMSVFRAGRYMEAERSRTGNYPTLLPARLLADDPFRPGQPLQYRFETPDKAYVWSIGPDRKDNGGRRYWDLTDAELKVDESPFSRAPYPGDYVY